MRLRRRKRGGGGGEDHCDALVLGFVGLGDFARLVLPDSPDGLELAATFDHATGRISVSLGGDGVAASPADLAAALALPPGPVGLPAGVDPAYFSSAEAIAAVRGFVRDQVLLGIGEDAGPQPVDVAAALRLVEEGKPYEVDWAGLVWAVLKREVVAGTPRRCAPYLLHLMECRRPELFAEVDGGVPLGKRWKGQTLQQCQGNDEKIVICEEQGFEEKEEDASMIYGAIQEIGDLEEMSIFNESKEVTVAASVDCNRAFLAGEEILGLCQENDALRSRNCFPSDDNLLVHKTECNDGEQVDCGNVDSESSGGYSSFARPLCAIFDQNDSSSSQKFFFGSKSQPGSFQKHVTEFEDEDADNNNVSVVPSNVVTRNAAQSISPYLVQQQRGMEGVCSGQTLSPFNGVLQQTFVFMHRMKRAYSDKEKDCRQAQAEVMCLREMVMEKDNIIAATTQDILKELQVRHAQEYRLKQERTVMCNTIQQYKKLLRQCSANFQEYKNRMSSGEGVEGQCSTNFWDYKNMISPGEGVESVVGTTVERKRAEVSQLRTHCHNRISWAQNTLNSVCLKFDEKITKLAKGMADLNHEVQRLKDSISIPDLNNVIGDDGEGETSPSKTEDKAQAGEGGRLCSTIQGGKQIGELTANTDQRNDAEVNIDVNGV